jgi:hypothetical protein
MDAPYRYWIEVPPGLSRLVIELFDADIGDGGTGEATAGRDRLRGSGFNTTVTYSLFAPDGTSRAPSFTTGNTTLPAGGDNAWLSFFDSTGDGYADNFGAVSYSNNDGTFSWSTNWIETNDDNNANNGVMRVTGGELRLSDNGGGASTIERQADLSGAGFSSATFSFDFRTTGTESSDRFSVEVSGNGGSTWTNLETFAGSFGSSSRSYDISGFAASNTRIRFIRANGYTGNDSFYVDNLRITGTIAPGHWEVRLDQTAGGDDINAIGLRAHDGTSGSGGTELNVYYDSHNQYGVNPPGSGSSSRSYTFHPYITSGCSAAENDFDYDSDSGTVGSVALTSRSGSFTQTVSSSSLSQDDSWNRDTFSGWTSDTDSAGYGIWTADATISTYVNSAGINGNYANLWFSNFQAAANPPAANPTANAFRVYLPTDAGGAPSKPYIEQFVRYAQSGPNPPDTGQTSRYAVTVRVVNPAAFPITFSASNRVTSNVPGGGVTYAGSAAVGQGTILSEPTVGGTGDITWNPGTLAAGATAILTYRVNVTPASNGQRLVVTATPGSGNGTRATWVDETGNTTQSRATYTAGPLCEVAVTEGLLTQALISSFTAREENGAVVVEWQTASEAGTVGFDLYRRDAGSGWQKVNRELLLGLLHSPQGGTYRLVDDGISPRETPEYLLVEVEAGGGRRTYGPYRPPVRWDGERRAAAPETGYERTPHPPAVLAEPAASPAAGSGWGSAAAPATVNDAARLTVREPGLYYVAAADLAPFLGIPAGNVEKLISKGRLALTRLGQPVAWYPDLAGLQPGARPGGNQEKEARGLYFYGEPFDSLYSDAGVYRLSQGRGSLMSVTSVAPAGTAVGLSFPSTVHREQDLLPATVISPDPESDYWFWDFLQSGNETFGTRAFQVDAPGLAPLGDAELTVHLQGATASGVEGEHHAEIRVNGTAVGETRWQGIAAQSATFAVPAGLLAETGNQVEVTGRLDGGVPFSVFYFDSLELTYPRSFQAAGDALAVRAADPADVAVTGFSSAAVSLVDITDPALPRWVQGAAVGPEAAGASTFRIGFRPAFRDARYLAATRAGTKTPEMEPWRTAGLRSPGQHTDVLIVTTAALAPAAERLANHRRQQGLEAEVVDMAAVADEFGFGVASPHALRAFLTYAWQSWQKAPRYVVLAGNGTLDYRGLLGLGGNLIPPQMVQSPGGLFASDNRLADVDGDDGVPEMAIGRIPVSTAAELDAYVDKVIAYENGDGAPGADWINRALLLADAPDQGADFSQVSERLAGLLPGGYAPERIYLAQTPFAQARGQLFQALAQGVSLISYVGHGGLDRLTAEGLLASTDVPGLANRDHLPVLTALTCTVNRFGVPGVPPLGELLVKSADGGAAAVWAPSGLSLHGEAGLLAERFYRRLSDPAPDRLGDLITQSLHEFKSIGGDISMLEIYNLLGDPALRLRRAAGSAPAGPGSSGQE